jgi:hypothetical protein
MKTTTEKWLEVIITVVLGALIVTTFFVAVLFGLN